MINWVLTHQPTKMLFKKYLTFSFILAVSILCTAGYDTKAHNDHLVSQSKVEVRKFDQEKLNEYKSEKRYQYDKDYIPRINLIDRFHNWLIEFLDNVFNIDNPELIWEILKYLIILSAIALFIIYLRKTTVGSLFYSTPPQKVDFKVIEENIHELDFDQEINTAINQNNFRKAIRMLYLKTLKNLADLELIKWQINKTNEDYIREILNEDTRHSFEFLTHVYEFAWYGSFEPDEHSFNKLHYSFSNFNLNLPGIR